MLRLTYSFTIPLSSFSSIPGVILRTVGNALEEGGGIEWLLLSQLVNNAGRLMLYEELVTRVWGLEYRDDVQILRTTISWLGSKLEDHPNAPKLIRTTPKTGYIIDQHLA